MEWDLAYCREAFQCRILLCTWHVRRTWIKKLFKKCCNFEVQREMFRQLGSILYSTRCGPNAMDAIDELMQIFVDQCDFIDYLKSHILAIIGIFWLMVNFAFIWTSWFMTINVISWIIVILCFHMQMFGLMA